MNTHKDKGVKMFKSVTVNGKTYKVNKIGTSIQLPKIENGKLVGKIKVI